MIPAPVSRRALLAAAAASAAFAGCAAPASRARPRVVAIFTVPLTQQWASRVHAALLAQQARGAIDYDALENVADARYERVLREIASSGPALVVGEAFGVEDATRRVALEFPRVAFLMGSSHGPQAPNFAVFDNVIHEPVYLGGMVAAGMSASGRIGLVGGYPLPEVNRLMNAFMAGAREVNPAASFVLEYVESWSDAARAREAGLRMIDRGVDVLFAERSGAIDAARERGRLAIGNVIDAQAANPATVVVSALWNAGPTIDRALDAVRTGRFVAEDYRPWSTMRHGGAALSPFGTFAARVPRDLVERVRARERQIVEGRFVVAIDDALPAIAAR